MSPFPGAPTSSPWPQSAVFDPRGLTVGGLPVARLAERYGTPLIVFDAGDLRSRMRAAKAAFPRALYAVKAFTAHAVIRIALDEGLDLLASTGGEVEACLRAGSPGPRIAMHGRNKSEVEFALAVRSGLSLVIVDGADDMVRLDAVARAVAAVQPVLLRVVPEVRVDTHEAIATGHETSTFGTPIPAVSEVVELATTLPGVRFAGLHAHLGSQVLESEPFQHEVDALVGLLAALRERPGVEADLLDVGGGFGITYTDERPPSLEAFAAAIRERLAGDCADRGLPTPTLLAEPGRSLVGNAAVTLYRVGDRKTLPDGRSVLSVDGGMSDNVRPMLYDARYAVAAASRPPGGAQERFTIVGRHCESGDVLAADVSLPSDIARGELLAFAATGAYTYSLASSYNRVGRPAVVAVREGSSEVWLRREEASDLDRLEATPMRPGSPAVAPAGIQLRAASPRDAHAFVAFWSAIVAEGGFVRSEEVATPIRVYRSRFRRSWSEREAQVVALDGERIVGHVYIQREPHPVTRHVATLGIAVAADHRRRGIGAALMEHALRWCRGVGVEKVMLSVYPHNTAAIALYRRFGFVEEGRLVGHSRKSTGYEDEILMSVWIDGGRGS
jgi:diaminopimelate decarboxylase